MNSNMTAIIDPDRIREIRDLMHYCVESAESVTRMHALHPTTDGDNRQAFQRKG